MEQIIQLNSGAKLSPHFTLGELTKTCHKVYNITGCAVDIWGYVAALCSKTKR